MRTMPTEQEWETIYSVPLEEQLADDASSTSEHDGAPIDQKSRCRVSFGVVEVREYPIILGDHPSARYGVPLTIDWDYEEREAMSVVDFDAAHGPHYKKMREMRLSPYYKRTLLRQLQYSGQELKQREREMLKIQRQRKVTKFFVRIQKFEEKFTKSLKNGLQKKGSEKKKEEKRSRRGRSHAKKTVVVPVMMNDQPKKKNVRGETRRTSMRQSAPQICD